GQDTDNSAENGTNGGKGKVFWGQCDAKPGHQMRKRIHHKIPAKRSFCSFAPSASSIRLVERCSISWRISIRNSRCLAAPPFTGHFGCLRQWPSSQNFSAPSLVVCPVYR